MATGTSAAFAPEPGRFWAAVRATRPLARPRDAAAVLGVSEAEVVAAGCPTGTTTRLDADWPLLLARLRALGPLRAVTRNALAALETRGLYTVPDAAGTVRGEGVAVRCDFRRWAHAFALCDARATQPQRGLQVFDASGTIVHEVLVDAFDAVAAFDRVIAGLAHADQSTPLAVQRAQPPAAPRPADAVDAAALLARWDAADAAAGIADLLATFAAARSDVLRLVGPARAWPVATWSLGLVLERAAAAGVPVALSVSSAGAVQSYGGPIRTARQIGPWVNVLDVDVSLHVRGDRIARAWAIRRGGRAWLDLLDASDRVVVRVAHGAPVDDGRWAALVDGLPPRA
jgi:putative hemin transport protein